jgi:hypothetical protein
MFSFCKHYFLQKFFCKEGAHCTKSWIRPWEPTIFLGKCLYQVRNVLLNSCSVDWKLKWLSFLSVLSVFVDFPYWMRLGVRYHCYYMYLVVCQQIWRNVLPLFFPRFTGVKKTQHYKLFRHFPRTWWVKPPTCMTVVNSLRIGKFM